MKEITIYRENNLLIKHRPLEVFINEKFVDYIEPNEKVKKFTIEEAGSLFLKVNKNSSNIVSLKGKNSSINLNVTSQIQNGLFIFISITFFSSFILGYFDLINIYMRFVLLLPFGIIAYWQTIGKKKYLRVSKRGN